MRERKQAVWVGIIYGVFLSFSFLLSGFQGTPDKLSGFIALTVALSFVGALGGLVAVVIGHWIRSYISK